MVMVMNIDERLKLARTLQKILERDYQITTNKELQDAIDRIGNIDISVFCAPIPGKEGTVT